MSHAPALNRLPILFLLPALALAACTQPQSTQKLFARVAEGNGEPFSKPGKSYGPSEFAIQLEDTAAETSHTVTSAAVGNFAAPGERRTLHLKVSVPRNAEITDIRAFLRNSDAPGSCDAGSTEFIRASLDGSECPIGEAYAHTPRVRLIGNDKVVSVSFENASTCNRRAVRLEVEWLPSGAPHNTPQLPKPEFN